MGTRFLYFLLSFLPYLSISLCHYSSLKHEVKPFLLYFVGYLINDVLVMEVLPFYVLTPIFLQIWLQQARRSCKSGYNPSFSSISLIRCYSVTTMDVSVLSLVLLRFLAGQFGCHCNNVYFCNNGVVGRIWGISGLWYKEAYRLSIDRALFTQIQIL